jgi:endonuclease/exonuclease/phosphatase family metal-dependent hydrolase
MIAAARAMGTRLVTLCTGTRDPHDQWRNHADNASPEAWRDLLIEMEKAVKLGEAHGVDLGIEPELANVVSSPAKARQLIGEIASPRLRIVLDPANLFEHGTAQEARDIVALVARILVDGAPVDVYVTHLYMSRGDDSLRLFQVQQLLGWIDTRADIPASIVCGDFNASLDAPSAALMAARFRPTQTAPTAFTPLADRDGTVSHPDRPRLDRCIDYIWVSGNVAILASEVCFNRPSPDDPSLWPSDHAGVWADLQI